MSDKNALDTPSVTKSNNINIKNWLRTNEAAEYLGLSITQIHNLKRNGTIPFTKIGGTIYFRRSDIDTVLEENYEGGQNG